MERLWVFTVQLNEKYANKQRKRQYIVFAVYQATFNQIAQKKNTHAANTAPASYWFYLIMPCKPVKLKQAKQAYK